MRSLRTSVIIILLFVLYFSLLEFISYLILVYIGYPPFDTDKRYQYGRIVSCYAASDNTPYFTYEAYDSAFNKVTGKIDEFGFISGSQKIAKEKPDNTFRIFIVGGSTAYGTVRMKEDVGDNTYPVGTYTYSASIAGQLLNILNAKYPKRHFEVINAAVVGHQMHQNLARYYEKIHDFDPDLIINIDGFNDRLVFGDFDTTNGNIIGDPFYNARWDFNQLIELEVHARNTQWPFTVNLINHTLDIYTRNPKEGKINDIKPLGYYNAEPSLVDYHLLEPFYIRNARKFLWVASAYEKQLATDHVHSFFMLQPNLSRRAGQKQLSLKETAMRSYSEKMPHLDSQSRRTIIAKWQKGKVADFAAVAASLMKEGAVSITTLRDGYFFSEFLSHQLDSITTRCGNIFIDLGEEASELTAGQELYTDYCHLTPYGNFWVAKKIATRIDSCLFNDQSK